MTITLCLFSSECVLAFFATVRLAWRMWRPSSTISSAFATMCHQFNKRSSSVAGTPCRNNSWEMASTRLSPNLVRASSFNSHCCAYFCAHLCVKCRFLRLQQFECVYIGSSVAGTTCREQRPSPSLVRRPSALNCEYHIVHVCTRLCVKCCFSHGAPLIFRACLY